MKRLSIAIIIAWMAIAGLYAQEKSKVQGEPGIKLEPVWEKEFEVPITDYIVDVSKKGEVLVRIVYSMNINTLECHFFDVGGQLTKNLNFKSPKGVGILQSKNGTHIGIYEITKGLPGDVEEVAFSLYDKDGNLLWANSKVKGLPFSILNSGLLLCSENPYGWSNFALWRQSQKLIKLTPNDIEMSTGSFAISMNDYMVFNVYGDKEEGQIGQLVLYDDMGREILRKKFNDWVTASKVCISNGGQFISARGGFANTLYTFSNNGKLLWQKHIGVGYLQTFSPNGSYLAASGPSNRLNYFNSITGDSLWSYYLDENRSFFALAVSKNGNFIAAADGAGRRENPVGNLSTIFLFDRKGNVVWKKELEIPTYKAPNIKFTDDGAHLLICNSNNLYCYKIVRGER